MKRLGILAERWAGEPVTAVCKQILPQCVSALCHGALQVGNISGVDLEYLYSHQAADATNGSYASSAAGWGPNQARTMPVDGARLLCVWV